MPKICTRGKPNGDENSGVKEFMITDSFYGRESEFPIEAMNVKHQSFNLRTLLLRKAFLVPNQRKVRTLFFSSHGVAT